MEGVVIYLFSIPIHPLFSKKISDNSKEFSAMYLVILKVQYIVYTMPVVCPSVFYAYTENIIYLAAMRDRQLNAFVVYNY